MASSAGNGCVRERWFFLLLDSFVIAVKACEDEKRDEEVKKRVDFDATEGVDCSLRMQLSMDRR